MSQSKEQHHLSQGPASSALSRQAVTTPNTLPSAAQGGKSETGAVPPESIRPESIRNVAGGVYNVDAEQVAASVEQEALSVNRTDAQHPDNDASQPAGSSSR
ncbi:MAG: hypothetical protein V4812_15060 [Pseudomonadota bacterium]